MVYTGIKSAVYFLKDTPFSNGGEGDVFDVINIMAAAKIYHKGVLSSELEEKIKFMVEHPPAQSIMDQIAWPKDCLYDDDGKFVGFVMNKLKIDSELGDLYKYPPKNNLNLSNEHKVILAINICRVIAEVHKAGYVFGDFNPRNIGVNLMNGHVAFLDTDSYHLYNKINGKTYRCVVCLNGYVAPELIKRCKNKDFKTAPLPTFTKETDRFSLAVHIFKLLFNGFTPYNGISQNTRRSQANPGVGNEAIELDNYCFKSGNMPMSVATPPLDAFPSYIGDLFCKAFIDGRNNPSIRPSAEDWDKALTRYKTSLKKCVKNSLHFYYNGLNTCPYCEADKRYQIMLNASAVYGNFNSQMNFSTPVSITPTPTVASNSTRSRQNNINYVPKQNQSNISRSVSNSYARPRYRSKKRIGRIILLITLMCVFFGIIWAAINYFKDKSGDDFEIYNGNVIAEFKEEDDHSNGSIENVMQWVSYDAVKEAAFYEEITGYCDSTDNRHWYHFKLDSSGYLDYSFGNSRHQGLIPFPYKLSWKFYIFYANGDVYSTVDLPADATKTGQFSINAGDYYLCIYIEQNYGYYNYLLKFEAEDNIEIESNDDFDTANKLGKGTKRIGTISTEFDSDYYTFDVINEGKVAINFDHEIFDENGEYWNVMLFDSNKKELLAFKVKAKKYNTLSKYIKLEPGTYFIRVWRGDNTWWGKEKWTDEKYELSLLEK